MSSKSWTIALVAIALTAASCSSSTAKAPVTSPPPAPATSAAAGEQATTTIAEPSTTATPTTTTVAADDATLGGVKAALAAAPAGCDALDSKRCLLPFPSNAYTTTDTKSATGRRVAFPAAGMSANVAGVAINPAEWNRNDGFSPNTPMLAYFAGLDATASKLPSWTDLQSSLAADATVVLIDEKSGDRIPLWAELDAQAASDTDRLLQIHAAVALAEGHTFVVGIRGMRTSDGQTITPSATFRVYRDQLSTSIPEIESRRPEMEAALAALTSAGVERSTLQLAWSFTTASADNIAGRMLHIRDDALAALGPDKSPAYTITTVTPKPQDNVALHVEGTYTVPNYLTGNGSPGNAFHYDVDTATSPDALPSVNGTMQAGFACNVSVATMAATTPAHLVEYGHGLLGSNLEINAGNVRAFANEDNIVFCATKWAGMSEDDVPNAVATLGQFGTFNTVADRLQQGVLNQIFLGRLMTRPGGLVDDKNFKRSDGAAMIDPNHLDFDGNSQGGIMGLMLAAVSPDIERAVLGVPGMNYSLLLPRSVDFATYLAVFKPAYPNDLDRVLILAMTQMLWDRGEGGGYAQHVTSNPYPGTKAKPLLLDVAFGDHQVSDIAAMVEARTIGATIHRPVTAPGRSQEVEPGWGLKTTTYPSSGSGVIVWDSGMAQIPLTDTAPSVGDDSHEDPRADSVVRRQKASFLFDDTLIDVCNGAPCVAKHSP
ncbi:MAG: hypothetical protein ABIQ39_05405 [Ilumatobacteraceae bacterium]